MFEGKKIERFSVNYSETGSVDVLADGYLLAYQKLHTTKTIDWAYEREVRFFIFGSPRLVAPRRGKLNSIVLGERLLTGEGLSGQALDSHMAHVRKLKDIMLARNAPSIMVAKHKPGMRLDHELAQPRDVFHDL